MTRGGSTLKNAESQKKIYGIDGYHMYKYGLPSDIPRWTIPKDEKSNFFNHHTRSVKWIPGPDKYKNDPSWKINQKNFGVGPKRKTFTDEAIEHSKQVPACT